MPQRTNRVAVAKIDIAILEKLLQQTLGFPDDVHLQYVYPDAYGRQLALVLASDRFEEGEPGCIPPNVILHIKHWAMTVSCLKDEVVHVVSVDKLTLED
jgi:hypothetical protein